MWKATFTATHDTCLIAPRCKKYGVTDYVHLLNAWDDAKGFHYTEAHLLEGSAEGKRRFAADFARDPTTVACERVGDYLFTLNRRPAEMSVYGHLWDKQLIQIKPVVQFPDGTERWELACWDKEPLSRIFKTRAKGYFRFRSRSISRTRTADVFLLRMAPRFTEKQKTALRLAATRGYFERPRKTDLSKMAREMGVSKQTFHQHLFAAQKKMVPLFCESAVSDGKVE